MKHNNKSNPILFSKVRGERGSILMITMMVMLLLVFMAIGILTLAANAIRMTTLKETQAQAFNIAESGCEITALWFRNLSSPETRTASFQPSITNYDLGGNTYSVTVYPDADNASHFLKTFTIRSTGTVRNTSVTIEVVLRQASFGRFAYFTDSEVSSSGGAIWWKTNEICDGPAHSNNTNGSNYQINYSNSTKPIFLDLVTGAGSSISYSPSTPTTETNWQKIFLNGSKGYRLGVPRIELPDSTSAQKEAAWGATSGFPTTTGVTLRANNTGGIYIYGDSTVDFVRNSNGTQNIVIAQSPTTSTVGPTKSGNVTTTVKTDKINNNTVTVDLAAGTSVLVKELMTTVTTTTATYSPSTGKTTTTTTSSVTKTPISTVTGGLPNGVIYSDGNITSLSGEITDNVVSGGKIITRSAWTIATNVSSLDDITIDDNLVYHTRPDKTKASNDAVNLAAGTLGLVAADINISDSAPTELEIDSVCMAGSLTKSGSFSVINYNSKSPGNLKLIGGVIQKNRGAVGTFNSSTGVTTYGYSKNYSYDTRMALDPPPFYPTTGTYERLSWRVVGN